MVREAYGAGADLVVSKARVDWRALASGQTDGPPDPSSAVTELEAFKQGVVHGTYLVHRRNITSAARSLGITRSSMQRLLRKRPPPRPMPGEDE